jgi:hypothetical protein
MAWTIDPHFASSMFAIPAFSPFSVGGGNRVLSLEGSGAAYRDELSPLNAEVSCTFSVSTIGSFGAAPVLILRRQVSDGSMYFSHVYFDNFSSGQRALSIYRYNGTLDTITSLTFSGRPATFLPIPPASELLTMKFRIMGDNLLASIFRTNGSLLIQTSTSNSVITAAGNPGLGGNITYNNTGSDNAVFMDDFEVRTL